jgi:hypothetical protein
MTVPRLAPTAVTVTAAVLVLVAGCGSDKTVTGSGTPAPAGGTATSSGQPSPTEQESPPLTRAQLSQALLAAADMPTGYKTDPSGTQDENVLTGDAGCTKMGATDTALSKGTRPDQAAFAQVSFTRPDGVGGGDEALASFATQAAAGTEYSQYVAAADACHSLGLKADANTTITLAGKPLTTSTVGDESHAYRYLGSVQGTTFWLDAMVFRTGSTLATVSVGGLDKTPTAGLLEQIATKAAGKLG